MDASKYSCYFQDCDSFDFYQQNNLTPQECHKVEYEGKVIQVCNLLTRGAHKNQMKCFKCEVGNSEQKCYSVAHPLNSSIIRYACERHIQAYKCKVCAKFDPPDFNNNYNFQKCLKCNSEVCLECVTKFNFEHSQQKQIDSCRWCK